MEKIYVKIESADNPDLKGLHVAEEHKKSLKVGNRFVNKNKLEYNTLTYDEAVLESI